ncbi:tRNA (cytidine(34)-2'-O)-methyltransferase [Corynebacterium tuscaniense]|nr:tRNA (cytidine(34)-2'-O)-methyltransferase [Corynebacterium tuscaniense]
MCAGTGATLHLVRPLGFLLDDKHLRRSGLDYHDLAHVEVHDDIDSCFALMRGNIYAFTTSATHRYTDVVFQPGDALLFGTEPTGLPRSHSHHERVTDQLRIPMLPGRRSMNLSNSAAVATYEAWRQLGFPGGV